MCTRYFTIYFCWPVSFNDLVFVFMFFVFCQSSISLNTLESFDHHNDGLFSTGDSAGDLNFAFYAHVMFLTANRGFALKIPGFVRQDWLEFKLHSSLKINFLFSSPASDWITVLSYGIRLLLVILKCWKTYSVRYSVPPFIFIHEIDNPPHNYNLVQRALNSSPLSVRRQVARLDFLLSKFFAIVI